MTQYVTFTLAAPLASFGTLAPAGRRTGTYRPTKSQIVGLVAAALGIERTSEAELSDLTASLGYAVRVEDPGIAETDYHTAQIPPTTHRRSYATRAEELAVAKHELATELSWREFRSGVFATVCLWSSKDGPRTLAEIADGLRAPAFTLFLGRKAFPLMLPCWPLLVDADSVAAALTLRDQYAAQQLSGFWRHVGFDRQPRGRTRPPAMVYADADSTLALGLPISRRQSERDLPDSRAKWRFRVREEVVA